VRLGYFTPDYTAYEDLLTTFPSIDPVHIELTAAHKFKISPAEPGRAGGGGELRREAEVDDRLADGAGREVAG
jgi:hypothetical protein